MSLWAYKFLIATVSALFLVLSGIYALRADKVYTAHTTFTLGESGASGSLLSNIGGELGALAGLLGTPSGGGAADALIERVSSRDFILEVATDLDLKDDELFNDYNPDYVAPAWKALIKSLIGMQNVEQDPENIQIWNIVSSYQELVSIEATDAGALQISVEHQAPERAAQIANFLTSKIISMMTQESEDDIDKKLRYLSQTLANALQDLELAQNALKQYSLKNSTQAVESFAVGSVLLDDLRTQRMNSAQDLAAILALKATLSAGSPTPEDYEDLRTTFPEIDQASFRRIMGLSEVTNAWNWPSTGTVVQVEASIRDRLASLDREIRRLSDDALRYASSAEELAQLTRNLKIAEAAYTVLIEQVKTQSLVAGFQPDNSKIFASADVPMNASEPKRSLILALGLVLGIFVGSALALVLSLRRGVYFTLSSLLEAVGANHAHSIRKLKSFKGKDIAEVQQEIIKTPLNWARQTVLELDDQLVTRPVFVCDVSSENRGDVLGRIIATTAGNLGRNTAFFDLSRTAKDGDQELSLSIEGKIGCATKTDGCVEYVYVSGERNLDMMYSKSFKNILAELLRKHDIVIFSANSEEIDTVVASSVVDELFVIARVRPGKTTIATIKKLLKRSTVGVALYG